jgi:hypothetical protein
MYCPANYAKRQELAKIICMSMEQLNSGSCLSGQPCTGVFSDVPSSDPFCSYVEGIYNASVISGCQTSPLLFCPVNEVTREQMAKFLVKAFNFKL